MAITRYDVESFLADLEQFLKDNLNTQIGLLNAEKADSITLKTVDSEGYFLQTMNDRVANFNPFIFYGVESVSSESPGPYVKKDYRVDVVIVLADQGEDTNSAMGKRLFRYSRVFEDLFTRNWANLKSSVKIKIEILEPISFRLVNSSEDFRAVGVALEFSLGA